MTTYETLPQSPTQEFTAVQSAVRYLGENEALLFGDGSQVRLYEPAIIPVMTDHGQQNLDRLILTNSFDDITSFEQEVVKRDDLQAPLAEITDAPPADAQQALDSILQLATAQRKTIGIINRPHPSGYSNYFVLLADNDQQIGNERVLSPSAASTIPFIKFDTDLHDVYSALRVAQDVLTGATTDQQDIVA